MLHQTASFESIRFRPSSWQLCETFLRNKQLRPLLSLSSNLKYVQSAAITLTSVLFAPDWSLIAQSVGERHVAVKWCGAVISEYFHQ